MIDLLAGVAGMLAGICFLAAKFRKPMDWGDKVLGFGFLALGVILIISHFLK